jgi:endonuclease YncB( thermonuclease family)
MAFLTLAAMFFYIWAKDKDKQRNTWKSFFLRFLGVPLLLFLAFVLYDFTGQHYFATGAKSFLLADFGKYVREVQNGTTFDAAWRGRPQITYNLQGVDPPKESPFREEAVQALWSYLSDANTIQYYYDSKFQRGTVIARLKLQDGRDLATALIRMGLAVPEFTFFSQGGLSERSSRGTKAQKGYVEGIKIGYKGHSTRSKTNKGLARAIKNRGQDLGSVSSGPQFCVVRTT